MHSPKSVKWRLMGFNCARSEKIEIFFYNELITLKMIGLRKDTDPDRTFAVFTFNT